MPSIVTLFIQLLHLISITEYIFPSWFAAYDTIRSVLVNELTDCSGLGLVQRRFSIGY